MMSNLNQTTTRLQQRKKEETRAAAETNRKYRLIAAIGMFCSALGLGLIYLSFNWGFSMATAKAVFAAGVFLVIASFIPIFYGMTKQV